MNSTRRYSVRKIVSRHTCFHLSLDTKDGGTRNWIFPNAPWVDKRRKALGIEVTEGGVGEALRDIFPSVESDFFVSGKCATESEGPARISFRVEASPLLRGNYVLLCPGWGRRTARKMWLLIPSSGIPRGLTGRSRGLSPRKS